MAAAESTSSAEWDSISRGLDVMLNPSSQGMSNQQYMTLYDTIYSQCTFGSSSVGSRALSSSSSSSVAGRSGAQLGGGETYAHLKAFLLAHVGVIYQRLKPLQGLDLLTAYNLEWSSFTSGASFINKLFSYLNRHWIKREKEEGRHKVFTVFTLCLVQWKLALFAPLQAQASKLSLAILQQIENQRDGKISDTHLVKTAVETFVHLGLDDADSTRQNLDEYRAHFEADFLRSTAQYYKAESEAFLAQNSVSDYMKRAEERLREEQNRVDLMLHASSRKNLLTVCEAELLDAHKKRMVDECSAFLANDAEGDLSRAYNLISRTSADGLAPLKEIFRDFVYKSGLNAVKALTLPAQPGDDDDDDDGAVDPKAYVEALLSVQEKSMDTLHKCFQGDREFQEALDKACTEFINMNAATGKNSSKSPELLARHTDALLKKGNKTAEEEDLEADLDRVIKVFKYLRDNDVYQKFYSKQLAKRLISSLSASDDAEANMIKRLEDQCGFEYSSKLQKMFTAEQMSQDMTLSKELTAEYGAKAKGTDNTDDVDMTIMVLASNNWPLLPIPNTFKIPALLQPTYSRFNQHYYNKHMGRKLEYLWHLSKTEIRTTGYNQKYIFLTSIYQAAVLVMFNDADAISQADMSATTGLPDESLKPILAILLKAKVLSQKPNKDYIVNTGFRSKKLRINLNMAIKADVKTEQRDVLRNVAEDRIYQIQATIVRVMKARKELKHELLIQEVVAAMMQRFSPKISDVKKGIDTLIDKEYLERVEEERNTYRYMA